ncbi:MAG: hypothetical protein Q4G09_04340 [Clostridia bacterium]|nr:hypothetical protein [Clostridia bacterium]
MKHYFKIKNADTSTTDFADWLLFGIIGAFLFLCFMYSDIIYTTAHSNNIFTALLQGNFFGVYEVNYGFTLTEFFSTPVNVVYDLPIYIFFMIWNFPVWIIQNILKINLLTNLFSLLWTKSLLIFFLFACSCVVKKICRKLNIKETLIKWIILIFVSSPLVFSSLFIIGQYDIIALFFILLGIYAYMNNDYKKFILWFAIAIPLKLFAIFAFIPLVLLKEKKITKIILSIICGCLILAVSRFFSSLMPYYIESTELFNSGMLDRLLSTSVLQINLGEASAFFIAYFILCIFCYIKSVDSENLLKKYAIYIPFASFSILFLLVLYHPFWLIYTTPFFAILLFINPKYFKVNLILDMVMSASALISQIYYFYWCFGAKQINNMLIPHLFGYKEDMTMTVKDILENLQISKFLPAVLAAYFACVVCMLIINFPKDIEHNKSEEFVIERSVIWSRMLIIVPTAILMIVCYYH